MKSQPVAGIMYCDIFEGQNISAVYHDGAVNRQRLTYLSTGESIISGQIAGETSTKKAKIVRKRVPEFLGSSTASTCHVEAVAQKEGRERSAVDEKLFAVVVSFSYGVTKTMRLCFVM